MISILRALVIALKLAVFPIALISNGEFNFTPFTVTTEPLHIIAVVDTILCPFIDIASAPEFFISFIISLRSSSCTNTLLIFTPNSFAVAASLSLSVNIIPDPVISVSPK